ncbi:MAG: hypothetical protein ACXQS8_02925, partial [Candidatus Helarchaeales archaeon]
LTSGISQITTSSVLYFNITSNSTISLINSSTNDVFACYRETNPSNDVMGGDQPNGRVLAFGDSDIFKTDQLHVSDNYRLANNTLEWLLERRIIGTLTARGEKEPNIYRVGEFIYFSLYMQSPTGEVVLDNQTMALVVFLFPDNTYEYWLALPAIENGWFNTIWLDNLTNSPGKHAILIYVNSTNALTTAFYQEFYLQPSTTPEITPHTPIIPPSIVFGPLITLSIIGAIISFLILTFLINRKQLRRRMAAITTERKKWELKNVLSSIVALNEELHEALANPKISEEEKVLIYRASFKKQKKLQKKAKKLEI